jgi:hypothetical protein
MEEYYDIAEELLSNKDLIYLFEAESDFYFDEAAVTGPYGNTASFGKVLSLDNEGTAWLPLQILRAGNYSMSIRLIGEGDHNKLNVSLGNNSYDLKSIGGSDFTWLNVTNIPVTVGYHDLKFSISPPEVVSHLSFEEGWNSTRDAPELWFLPQPEFSDSLDPRTKTDGEYSLMLTTDSTDPMTWSRMYSHDIILEPNNHYKASIDVRTRNVNNSIVRILGYNVTSSGWETLTNIVSGLDGATDWNEYSSSFFLPESMSRIRVVLNAGWVLYPGLGDASTWFDDFKLIYDVEGENFEIDRIALFIDENNRTLDDIFEPDQVATVLDYEKIDATKYELKISSTEPFILGFAEGFDEFWVAHVDGLGDVKSIPLYSLINGYYINKTGNFTVILEYEPQNWYNIGLTVTGVTVVGSFCTIMWVDRRIWGAKLRSLYENLAKVAGIFKGKA